MLIPKKLGDFTKRITVWFSTSLDKKKETISPHIVKKEEQINTCFG